DRQPLLFTAGYFHSALADDRVQALVRAGQQALAGRLVEHVQAFDVRRLWINEQQVLADRAREQLRVLRDEPNALTEHIEIDSLAGDAVVEDASRSRRVQPDQQL